MPLFYIGIGSNLCFGELSPEELIAVAVRELGKVGGLIGHSSLYRTEPVGMVDQPAFVNAAVAVETRLEPEELLRALIGIEREYGRDRTGQNGTASVPKGPRTLDLDLLLAVDERGVGIVHASPSLTLPHAEMAHRRFVLAPLAEIAPELRHPVLGRTVAELLAGLASEGPNAVEAVQLVETESEGAR
jgi:2-amino-4-hydroxy-6-hydroxymethyldihydropteridine diphosphokinase